MKTAVKTGIVLLNYNSNAYTDACMESLRKADLGGAIIVIVDNSSRPELVEELKSKHQDVAILALPDNGGFSKGNNAGIRYLATRGCEQILLLNVDTIVAPDFLGKLLDKLESDPRCGVVGASLMEMDLPDKLQSFGGGKVNYRNGRGYVVSEPVPETSLDFINGACMLIRTEVFAKIGLLAEETFLYWEDPEFCARAKRAGFTFGVAPLAKVWHKTSSITGAETPFYHYHLNRSAMIFMRKHAPFPLIPCLIGGLGRCINRLLSGRFDNAKATLRGMWNGWRTPLRPIPKL